MKGKLLFIAPSAYTLGGIQTWLNYILPGLMEKGWLVTLGLVSGRFHNVDSYLQVHPFSDVIRISAPTGTIEGREVALMNAIRDICPDIVVNLNIVDTYHAVSRLCIQENLDIKVVATFHGLQPDFLEDYSRLRKQIDAVVCTNKLANDLVLDFCNFSADRVMYAPYGVDEPEDISLNIERWGGVRIAYSGRIESFQKRIFDVAAILDKSVKAGMDIKLVIAGAGPEETAFKDKIRSLRLESYVEFLGILDRHQLVHEVYKKCDVLLLTSSWETGPIVAWEALREGMLFVTSDYLGRKREGSLVDCVNCLVFPVGDINAAVECLKIGQNPEIRQKLIDAGKNLIMQKYSCSKSIEKWSACLDAIQFLPPLDRDNYYPENKYSGRLDKLFGRGFGEIIRRILKRGYTHAEPGGEWPHSYGTRKPDDAIFWKRAHELNDVYSV